jgi:hypothetical protein
MDFNSEYIISQAECIQNDKKTLSRYQLESKHEEFAKKYPKLWLGIMDNVFNIEQFKELVNIRNKAYTNTRGDHADKSFSSDVEVGEVLARKFLYKSTGEPTKQQKNSAYSKVLAKSKQGKNTATVEEIEKMEVKSLD